MTTQFRSKRYMHSLYAYTLVALSATAWAAPTISAPSEIDSRLSEAIYAEDIVGDLDKAIHLYESIIESRKNNDAGSRESIAKTYLRLAQCQLKLDQKSAAQTTLTQLVDHYSDIEDVSSVARTILDEELSIKSELLPAPWEDGEQLEFETFGVEKHPIVYTTSRQTRTQNNAGGEELLSETTIFQVNNRFFFHQSSRVSSKHHKLLAATLSNMRQSMEFRTEQHSLIKRSEPQSKTAEITFPSGAFLESSMNEILRRLPLEAGKTKIVTAVNPHILSTFSMHATKALKPETLIVPAGTFKASEVTLDIYSGEALVAKQIVWLSETPERYILKIQFQNTETLLTSVSNFKHTPSSQYVNEENAFEMTVPANWKVYEISTGNNPLSLTLLSLETGKVFGKVYRKTPDADHDWDPNKITEAIQWNKNWFDTHNKMGDKYTVRENETKLFKIRDKQAMTYIADYMEDGKRFSEYRFVLLNNPHIFHAVVTAGTDDLDDHVAALETIIKSIRF